MEARGFMTVLAYVRMRRRMMRKHWSRLSADERRSGRFSKNFELIDDINTEIRSSKLVKHYKNHEKNIYFCDILWKYCKDKHDVLAIFFNSHLYFGRKELTSIFVLRVLIKISVLSVLFDLQKEYSTHAILYDGRTDVIGFKIIVVACSMLVNKIMGSLLKFLFAKYVKAKHDRRVAFYREMSGWSKKKPQIVLEKGKLYEQAKSNAKKISMAAWKHLQVMRVFVWFVTIILIMLCLLWIWAFSFALKKEDEGMLTDWIGTAITCVLLWVFVTRPIQIIVQSIIKYLREKRKWRKGKIKESMAWQ